MSSDESLPPWMELAIGPLPEHPLCPGMQIAISDCYEGGKTHIDCPQLRFEPLPPGEDVAWVEIVKITITEGDETRVAEAPMPDPKEDETEGLARRFYLAWFPPGTEPPFPWEDLPESDQLPFVRAAALVEEEMRERGQS